MNNKPPQQLARELAEKCAEKLKFCSLTGHYAEIILRELNLEQLIADKERLDWGITHPCAFGKACYWASGGFLEEELKRSRQVIDSAMSAQGKEE